VRKISILDGDLSGIFIFIVEENFLTDTAFGVIGGSDLFQFVIQSVEHGFLATDRSSGEVFCLVF